MTSFYFLLFIFNNIINEQNPVQVCAISTAKTLGQTRLRQVHDNSSSKGAKPSESAYINKTHGMGSSLAQFRTVNGDSESAIYANCIRASVQERESDLVTHEGLRPWQCAYSLY